METAEKLFVATIVAAVVGFVGLMVYVSGKVDEQRARFSEACEASGGKPVHNGKHMECIK